MQTGLLMCKWANVSEQNTGRKSKFWIGQIMVSCGSSDWTENMSNDHVFMILLLTCVLLFELLECLTASKEKWLNG